MIVVYKNFFRNKMVNLSMKSVRHFVPNAQFYCISLFKEHPSEYQTQEPLEDNIKNIYVKTEVVFNNGKVLDHIDDTQTAGYANPMNVAAFSEGFNIIVEYFKDVDEKVLILAEDHFFTTGAVLKELVENDWDLAHAPWDTDLDGNASILGIRPKKVSHLFPIPLSSGWIIEVHLFHSVFRYLDPAKKYKINNRKHINYFGDGIYTNSSEKMKQMMEAAGIL